MRTAGLGRPARSIGWLAVAVALALGGSGLVAQVSHPPGDTRREELTYSNDVVMTARLDAIADQLTQVSSTVDGLSADAKAALLAVASGDGDALKLAIDRGSGRAASVQTTIATVRSSLAGLPGDGPAAAVSYANTTLVRRADLLAALDSVAGLGDLWDGVTARAGEAATLILAIRNHDSGVAGAASLGVQAQYAAAIEKLAGVQTILAHIVAQRQQVVTTADSTILDDWITRHQRYDRALLALYKALKASGGVRNPVVDAAYREENLARQGLPPNNREIVVIVAEVAQGGLNQAVVAIEDARGRIDQALTSVSPT
jgi:hypothetical protein